MDFKLDRNDLRPVKWEKSISKGFDEVRKEPMSGYFHKWFSKETYDGGKETQYALIECENGEMTEVKASDLTFTPKRDPVEVLVERARSLNKSVTKVD